MIGFLKNYIRNFLHRKIYERNFIAPRRRYAKRDLSKKLNTVSLIPINEEKLAKVKNFWSQYSVTFDYKWFDFFNTIDPESDCLEYYIPHDLYYCYIDPFYSDISKAKAYDDKNMYDLYFHDVPQPKTLLRILDNALLDNSYQTISVDDAMVICKNESKLIIKPSIDSEGGSGIRFWDSNSSTDDELRTILNTGGNYIIQSIVKQCKELSNIHKNSLNTIRIISLTHNGETRILSSVLRMGVDGACVDNASSGGIFCGITDDGRLKKLAYDTSGNVYFKHPQGGELDKYVIPNFNDCKKIVYKVAPRLSHISKLCSWDICIDQTNTPTLIEVNLSYGGVQLHQLANGPIFGKLTPVILNEILKKIKR